MSWGGESRNYSGNTTQRAASGLQSRCISVDTSGVTYGTQPSEWKGLLPEGSFDVLKAEVSHGHPLRLGRVS